MVKELTEKRQVFSRIQGISTEVKMLVIVSVAGLCLLATGAAALSQLSTTRYSGQEEATQAVVETALGTLQYFEGWSGLGP